MSIVGPGVGHWGLYDSVPSKEVKQSRAYSDRKRSAVSKAQGENKDSFMQKRKRKALE
jgi:hypothetical protein